MQRRAAALYAAFFVIIAAGSYAMIGVAQEPAISVENPAHSLATGDEITVDGRTYRASISGGEAELTWVEQDAQQDESWDAGSTVTVGGTDYTVLTDVSTDPSSMTLREDRSLDENVTTVEVDGATRVVVEENGQEVLVPREDYLTDRFGPPETREYRQGDRFAYQNNTVTVASITNGSVGLEWTAPAEHTVTAAEGDNVTLNGQGFVAHFPDGRTLELSSDFRAYQQEVNVVETFHERMDGLWGVSILSALAAITLLGLSYLPSRY